MKLADAPDDVRAELKRKRTNPYTRRTTNPPDGELWFPDFQCAVCGCEGHPIHRDHCHTTGLARGHLCPHHNNEEGRLDSPLWDFWSYHAPWLAEREIHVMGSGGRARARYLTDDEVLTLPMADLFAMSDARQGTGWSQPKPEPCTPCAGRGVTQSPLAVCRVCGGTGLADTVKRGAA